MESIFLPTKHVQLNEEWGTKLPLMTSFIFMGLMEHCQQNSTESERDVLLEMELDTRQLR